MLINVFCNEQNERNSWIFLFYFIACFHIQPLFLTVMKGNYDTVAPFYDWLSRFVFRDAILQAHSFLVDAIPASSSVLIAGGGTGFILEEILRKHAIGLEITYVDISKKMIALSKKRNIGGNKVLFINKSIHDAVFLNQFDVVITPFFLDNFTNSTAKTVFAKIDSSLASGGLWLFADFQLSEINNVWQKILLQCMYFFFRLLCGIEASHLPDTASFFEKYKYQQNSKQTFFRNFIYASIHVKPDI